MRAALALAAAILIVAGSALAPAAAQQPITLVGASQFNDDHAFNKTMLKFEELVKKYYGKPVSFRLHRNSELGLEKQYFEFMSQGLSVDYAVVAPSHMSTFSKAAPIMDMPFLFRDVDHFKKVMDADALQPIAEDVLKKADVLLIGYAGGGVRNIIAKKPVRNMAELKNLSIRVMGAPIQTRIFQAITAAPTVIAYNEVYNAIQTGVIQGAENEAAGMEQMKFYEVGPEISLTQHAVTIRPLCFSGKTFKRLPRDLQEAIVKAGKEARSPRPPDRVQRGRRAPGAPARGGQAADPPLHRAGQAPGAGRAGEAGLRQGDRGRQGAGPRQRHQVAPPPA